MGLKVPTGGSGGVIIFPASQSPSSNANGLDDYEEGGWVPTLQGGTTAGSYSIAVTSDSAKYTRIGRLIELSAHFTITVSIGGTGHAQFGGLPFPRLVNTLLGGSIYLSGVDLLTTTRYAVPSQITFSAAEQTWGIIEVPDNGSVTLLPVSAISNGAQVGVTLRYIV